MLGIIKKMINEQKAMLEAADVIVEETKFDNLDDMIVLGESNEELPDDESMDPDGLDNIKENGEDESIENNDQSEPATVNDEETDDGVDGDVLNDDIDSDPPAAETDLPPEDENNDDIMNNDINADLPTPIGAQTGEPAEMDVHDILSTEIDLVSNTPKDILPVPPAGAIDAVADNDSILNQRIDSGFENPTPEDQSTDIIPEDDGNGNNDLLNTDINSEIPEGSSDEPTNGEIEEGDPEEKPSIEEPGSKPEQPIEQPEPVPESEPKIESEDESDDNSSDNGEDEGLGESVDPEDFKLSLGVLSEAITIGGEEEESKDNNKSDDSGSEESGEENEVTSAVRDKVAEVDGEDQTPSEDENNDIGNSDIENEFPMGDEGEDSGEPTGEIQDSETAKEDVLEQLSKITKSLEDTKNAIIQSIH